MSGEDSAVAAALDQTFLSHGITVRSEATLSGARTIASAQHDSPVHSHRRQWSVMYHHGWREPNFFSQWVRETKDGERLTQEWALVTVDKWL